MKPELLQRYCPPSLSCLTILPPSSFPPTISRQKPPKLSATAHAKQCVLGSATYPRRHRCQCRRRNRLRSSTNRATRLEAPPLTNHPTAAPALRLKLLAVCRPESSTLSRVHSTRLLCMRAQPVHGCPAPTRART